MKRKNFTYYLLLGVLTLAACFAVAYFNFSGDVKPVVEPGTLPEGNVEVGRFDEKGLLININTADKEALDELPGIGPSTAQKIIDYRTEKGAFANVSDIKNVSGIGDKIYEQIKGLITVG